MKPHIFRPGGIPAAVSIPPSRASRLCLLLVKIDQSKRQAAVELRFSVLLRGFDVKHQINLIYQADHLVSGTTKLESTTAPQDMPSDITRNNGKELRNLSLTLAKPCIVVCPRGMDSIAPQDVDDFPQIVQLATAMNIEILFDFAWVHKSKIEQLCSLLTATDPLPLWWDDKKYNVTDWTIFQPQEETQVPPYSEAVSNHKRQLPSNSFHSPTSKRRAYSPTLGSPTEKATTTTATPSPRLLPSSPPMFEPDQEAVNIAVAKFLPGTLQAMLPDVLPASISPSSRTNLPVASTKEAIETAVVGLLPATLSNMLPAILSNMLPSILSNVLSAVSSSPSAPILQPFLQSLATHADSHITEMDSHAEDLRNTVHVELEEQLDDHRADISLVKGDTVNDVTTYCDDKLQELRERVTELGESEVQGLAATFRDQTATTETNLDAYCAEKLENFQQRITEMIDIEFKGMTDKLRDQKAATETKVDMYCTEKLQDLQKYIAELKGVGTQETTADLTEKQTTTIKDESLAIESKTCTSGDTIVLQEQNINIST